MGDKSPKANERKKKQDAAEKSQKKSDAFNKAHPAPMVPGKKVTITQKQDKSLIAGVITKIGDQVIDGSARARLANFREALLRT